MTEIGRGTWMIRSARADELHLLAAIEIDAFWALHEAGAVACEPTSLPLDVLDQSLTEDLLFVAVDGEDRPFGFLAGVRKDGSVHIAEIDVVRRWQKQGVGRRLIETAIAAARAQGALGVTLTTDRQAAFNAPFYASAGFCILEDGDRPAVLTQILENEISHGADPARRVAMALRF
ncbi:MULTISPECIES: GNAT family N-acetyltransferase [unclassified Rhizobium]|jgi:GNAT superfamily N-acetyltransferase|uniref:GNAT family N-acetyltransferase n=1 Tax=unclassified Rhizobium TaxID=2613769 RepID=UPI0006475DC5|nr:MULTISPECIES: GNAT family N-acetyltransferase [unclassified Rhizobium]MBN8951112.1 GNAT family N-acetyltransferase [Rhizobium tropici]OJY69143.1 MAG: GNAT family N-acetyltransferase [Rhizobium sp. 60-20]RKD73982.1 putative N-acetyltransferase YhbS [Rhizobium sp. WW_1]